AGVPGAGAAARRARCAGTGVTARAEFVCRALFPGRILQAYRTDRRGEQCVCACRRDRARPANTAMNSSLSSPRFSIAVFGVSLAIYLALAGWMTRVWKPLGDEPHYLLAAHSLVHDGDLDLANNYARGDYQLFFEGATLDPHVRITAVGQVLRHDLGLPFVLAPAYALGGRAGVEYFLACLAALL